MATGEATTINEPTSSIDVLLLSLAFVAASTALACWQPVLFPVLIVVLFAGPHNWLEARYFLSRIPPRWGKLTPYFALGLGGVVILATTYISINAVVWAGRLTPDHVGYAVHAWTIGFAVWLAVLLGLRARQNPRRRIDEFAGPIGIAFIGFAIAWPTTLSLILVFAHPLLAIVFLDRELRHRPRLQRSLRSATLMLPSAIALLWIHHVVGSPSDVEVPESDFLAAQLVRQIGATIPTESGAMFLVATHAVLESVHYAIWLVAIPVVTGIGVRTSLANAPLARRPRIFRPLLFGATLLLPLLVLALWGSFAFDYAVTRDIYFALAMTHVLAEIPFLIRSL